MSEKKVPLPVLNVHIININNLASIFSKITKTLHKSKEKTLTIPNNYIC